MAGTREVPRDVVEGEFESALVGGQVYVYLREDTSCILLVDRFDKKRGRIRSN